MAADPAPRRSLTRERILRAGLDLADEAGIEAVSMRALGRVLGVEAMSLYHHVPNKAALVRGLVDLVWSEVSLAPGVADWRAAVRRTARSAFVTMLGHPWVMRAMATAGGVARMRYVDASLGHLRRAGFTAEDAYHAHHVIEAYVIGFAHQALDNPTRDPAAERAAAEAAFRDVEPAAIPHLIEHAQLHLTHPGSGFDFGLDLILDGLERLPRPAVQPASG